MNHNEKIDSIMETATKAILQDRKAGDKVIKSLPTTKEEQKMFAQGQATIKEIGALLIRFKAETQKVWANVNIRLDSFGKKTRYNPETKEVEFMEEE